MEEATAALAVQTDQSGDATDQERAALSDRLEVITPKDLLDYQQSDEVFERGPRVGRPRSLKGWERLLVQIADRWTTDERWIALYGNQDGVKLPTRQEIHQFILDGGLAEADYCPLITNRDADGTLIGYRYWSGRHGRCDVRFLNFSDEPEFAEEVRS